MAAAAAAAVAPALAALAATTAAAGWVLTAATFRAVPRRGAAAGAVGVRPRVTMQWEGWEREGGDDARVHVDPTPPDAVAAAGAASTVTPTAALAAATAAAPAAAATVAGTPSGLVPSSCPTAGVAKTEPLPLPPSLGGVVKSEPPTGWTADLTGFVGGGGWAVPDDVDDDGFW
ncbi:hypothetical protein MMPV_001579 [Pyropia vietnamensis]